MTYLYKGKQYVVVSVEGNAATRTATHVVAFAIPDQTKTAAPPTEQ
jgi:glucose dehydrogenase